MKEYYIKVNPLEIDVHDLSQAHFTKNIDITL